MFGSFTDVSRGQGRLPRSLSLFARDSCWGRTGRESLTDLSDVIWINSRSGKRELLL